MNSRKKTPPTLTVRMDRDTLDKIRLAAALDGMSMEAWARKVMGDRLQNLKIEKNPDVHVVRTREVVLVANPR